MKIVKVFGGTGNQMFQYALYMSLLFSGDDVYLHDCIPDNSGNIRKIFDLGWREADREEILKYSDIDLHMHSRIRRKILGRKKSHYFQQYANYDNYPFIVKENCYLDGYWQSERYFCELREHILEIFDLECSLEKCLNKSYYIENKRLIEEIEKDLSVSVHVRRGDYVENKLFYKIYGKICTLKYYELAMNFFRERYTNVRFYLFTNDVEWVKEQPAFNDSDCIVAECNQAPESAIYDMLLMKSCKHNIIANSSFSWWGAWLNANSDKIVIAPDRWLNTEDVKDIYCKNWMIINSGLEQEVFKYNADKNETRD